MVQFAAHSGNKIKIISYLEVEIAQGQFPAVGGIGRKIWKTGENVFLTLRFIIILILLPERVEIYTISFPWCFLNVQQVS